MLPWSSATRSLGETKLLTSEHPTGVLGAVHGVIETLIEPSGCVLRSSPTLATSGATWVPASAPLKVTVMIVPTSETSMFVAPPAIPAVASDEPSLVFTSAAVSVATSMGSLVAVAPPGAVNFSVNLPSVALRIWTVCCSFWAVRLLALTVKLGTSTPSSPPPVNPTR